MSDEEKDDPPKITGFEWAVAIVSGISILAIVAFLLCEQFTWKNESPIVTVEIERIEKQPNQYLVHAIAFNAGDKTASRLDCAAELFSGTNRVEQTYARLEFLPPHARKKIGFFFTHDPREGELKLYPLGYEER